MTVHLFADGCPECLGELPVVPFKVVPLNGPHVRALYRCPGCSHAWSTGWDSSSVLSGQESQGGAA